MRLIDRMNTSVRARLRRLLMSAYGLDSWHHIPLSSKDYAQAIIEHINQDPDIRHKRVLEYGCGAGDILLNLATDHRTAIDISENAIRFLRTRARLRRRKLQHASSHSFPDLSGEQKFDYIICVNWIHNIEPTDLRQGFEELSTRLAEDGVVVMDTVDREQTQFVHRPDELFDPAGFDLQTLGPFARNRSVHFATRTPSATSEVGVSRVA